MSAFELGCRTGIAAPAAGVGAGDTAWTGGAMEVAGVVMGGVELGWLCRCVGGSFCAFDACDVIGVGICGVAAFLKTNTKLTDKVLKAQDGLIINRYTPVHIRRA